MTGPSKYYYLVHSTHYLSSPDYILQTNDPPTTCDLKRISLHRHFIISCQDNTKVIGLLNLPRNPPNMGLYHLFLETVYNNNIGQGSSDPPEPFPEDLDFLLGCSALPPHPPVVSTEYWNVRVMIRINLRILSDLVTHNLPVPSQHCLMQHLTQNALTIYRIADLVQMTMEKKDYYELTSEAPLVRNMNRKLITSLESFQNYDIHALINSEKTKKRPKYYLDSLHSIGLLKVDLSRKKFTTVAASPGGRRQQYYRKFRGGILVDTHNNNYKISTLVGLSQCHNNGTISSKNRSSCHKYTLSNLVVAASSQIAKWVYEIYSRIKLKSKVVIYQSSEDFYRYSLQQVIASNYTIVSYGFLSRLAAQKDSKKVENSRHYPNLSKICWYRIIADGFLGQSCWDLIKVLPRSRLWIILNPALLKINGSRGNKGRNKWLLQLLKISGSLFPMSLQSAGSLVKRIFKKLQSNEKSYNITRQVHLIDLGGKERYKYNLLQEKARNLSRSYQHQHHGHHRQRLRHFCCFPWNCLFLESSLLLRTNTLSQYSKITQHNTHKVTPYLTGILSRLKHMLNGAKDQSCPLCLAPIRSYNIGVTICNHLFCFSCLGQLFSDSSLTKCPSCRHPLTNLDIFKISHRNEYFSVDDYCQSYLVDKIGTKASYILKLVSELVRLDSQVKIVVFCQFQTVLNSLQELFHHFSIISINAESKKAQSAQARFNHDQYNVILVDSLQPFDLCLLNVSIIIFYDPIYTRNRQQIESKLINEIMHPDFSIQQRSKIRIYHLLIENSVETSAFYR